jgi:hypothetical protein
MVKAGRNILSPKVTADFCQSGPDKRRLWDALSVTHLLKRRQHRSRLAIFYHIGLASENEQYTSLTLAFMRSAVRVQNNSSLFEKCFSFCFIAQSRFHVKAVMQIMIAILISISCCVIREIAVTTQAVCNPVLALSSYSKYPSIRRAKASGRR